ncbi:MAG TPA: hypothetical protein VIY28_07545 [Pseudonocardiaceae bacterium]
MNVTASSDRAVPPSAEQDRDQVDLELVGGASAEYFTRTWATLKR